MVAVGSNENVETWLLKHGYTTTILHTIRNAAFVKGLHWQTLHFPLSSAATGKDTNGFQKG